MQRQDHDKEFFDGQNWVPWLGLALVLPAVLVLLIGAFGVFFGTERAPSGHLFATNGPGSLGIAAAAITMTCAFVGLMLSLVGLVRGLRRQAPHTGRSVGIAGFTLELGVLALAIIVLVFLGMIFF